MSIVYFYGVGGAKPNPFTGATAQAQPRRRPPARPRQRGTLPHNPQTGSSGPGTPPLIGSRPVRKFFQNFNPENSQKFVPLRKRLANHLWGAYPPGMMPGPKKFLIDFWPGDKPERTRSWPAQGAR